jgi:hypothetical protein
MSKKTHESLPGDLLALWVEKGRPIVYLGNGQSTENLEKVINFKLTEIQTAAILAWYKKNNWG